MASPNSYPSAFASSGPDVAALAQNWMSGSVFWVDSATGNNANAGTEPELPKATWVNAYAAAAAGDLILCAPGHTEIVSVAQTLALANVTTIGLGVGTQRARFTSAVAGVMMTVSGTNTHFFSCYFAASTAATTGRIETSAGTGMLLSGCYFENGANDTTNCVRITTNDCRVEGCDFVATASRPSRGVNIAGGLARFYMKDCLFDGGAFGWTNAALNVTAAATNMTFEDVRLANRSDLVMTTTGTTYKLFGVRPIDNSGCRIVIAA